MVTFYNGLNAHTGMVVDALANGALLTKSYNKEYGILERISNNNYQWPNTTTLTRRRVTRVHEVDTYIFGNPSILYVDYAQEHEHEFIKW